MQSEALRDADGLMDPKPGVLLLDHGRVEVAHEEEGLDIDDVVGLEIELVEMLLQQ